MSKKKEKKNKKARKAASNGFYGRNAANAANTGPGLLGNLGQWLQEHPSEQFLLGALLGATAAYVLGHEELRARILKGGIELYGNLAGSLAEIREQMADIKAEVEAETLAGGARA
ncbi:MAG: YtxH domain-containing protein [Zoogloeaceae bacterium]|jgi:hypothetical protein|nr:YtxH domain-containing protein [Zoogloeaceae bacterium]